MGQNCSERNWSLCSGSQVAVKMPKSLFDSGGWVPLPSCCGCWIVPCGWRTEVTEFSCWLSVFGIFLVPGAPPSGSGLLREPFWQHDNLFLKATGRAKSLFKRLHLSRSGGSPCKALKAKLTGELKLHHSLCSNHRSSVNPSIGPALKEGLHRVGVGRLGLGVRNLVEWEHS